MLYLSLWPSFDGAGVALVTGAGAGVVVDDHGEGVAAAFLPYGEGVDAHFLPDCGTGDGLRLVSNRRISLSNEGASTCRSAASRREHVDDHLQKGRSLQ